jgi:hypothetical protein
MEQHPYDVREAAYNTKITEARYRFPNTKIYSRPYFAVPRTFLALGPLFVSPLLLLFRFLSLLLNVSVFTLDCMPRADGLLQQLVA